MPTPATVLDNTLRHIGAAIYIAVLLFLVGFLIHETYIQVKFEIKRQKEKKMLEYVKGNIVTGDYTIFCQQVNCKHRMGSGLARQIRNVYPEVYREYMNIQEQILGYILPVFTTDGRICINMFAQNDYGKDGKCYTNYTAFKNCLTALVGFISDHHIKENVTIAFPYGIGCGLGGGDWHIIQGMIKDFSEMIPQKVVIVNLK